MYPQEEIASALKTIEDTLLTMNTSKDDTMTMCKLLTSMSLDIQQVTVLFNHAHKLKRMDTLREEKKHFLRFVSTIELWAKYKDWGELCNSLVDVGDDLLTQIERLITTINKKGKKQKTETNKLLSSKDEDIYLDRVEKNKQNKQKELREQEELKKQQLDDQLHYLRGRAEHAKENNRAFDNEKYKSQLPAIFSMKTKKKEPKPSIAWGLI